MHRDEILIVIGESQRNEKLKKIIMKSLTEFLGEYEALIPEILTALAIKILAYKITGGEF